MSKYVSSFVVVFLYVVCLTCTDAEAPQMYGNKRSQILDKVNWRDFMKSATWVSDELIKKFTPYVVENYPIGNVSEACTKSLMVYIEGIKNWKRWAINMFDVTGKLPSSFKKGASIEFGSYDTCLRIDVPSHETSSAPFIGQFCMLHLQTSSPYLLEEETPFKKYALHLVPNLESTKRILNLHLGLCIPSPCSQQDISNIITALTKSKNVTASVSNCETKETNERLEPTNYALKALGALLCLCLIGTILDSNNNEHSDDGTLNTGVCRQSLIAFSIRTNIHKLFEKESVSAEIRRICGVLFLLCIWVIACNTIIYPTRWKEMRYTSFRDISMAVRFADSFVVAMDAIFFVSGILSIFVLWRITEKSGGIASLFKEFLKIYFRLSAINAFTLLFSFVLPLIYYGPLWNQTWNNELVRCQSNGWINLFNAQTHLPLNDRCFMHTWYPALAMQCLLGSIPLIFLLNRHPKIGFIVGILLSAAIVSTSSAFSSKMLDSLHYFEMIRVTVAGFYSTPLFYCLPYLLGILAGRIAIHFKDQQLSIFLHAVGWSLSIAIFMNVLADGNFSKLNLEQSPLDLSKRTFYLCIALFWMMYASIVDGVVGRILSSGAIWLFAQVSYSAYMIHVLFILVREAALKERIYIGKLTLTIELTSHAVLAFIFGAIVHLIVELPFARLYEIYTGHSEEDSLKVSAECSNESSETSGEEKKDS